MPEQRSPLEIRYAPGSYSSPAKNTLPGWPGYPEWTGRSSPTSWGMLDQGAYLGDEAWESMKEEAISRPMHHQQRRKIQEIISYMDKYRTANADRPRVPSIRDTRSYWENFIADQPYPEDYGGPRRP